MSGVLWPTELAMRLSDAGAGLACRKAPKNMPSTAIVPSHPLMLGGRVAALTPASEVPPAGVGPATPGLGNRRSIR